MRVASVLARPLDVACLDRVTRYIWVALSRVVCPVHRCARTHRRAHADAHVVLRRLQPPWLWLHPPRWGAHRATQGVLKRYLQGYSRDNHRGTRGALTVCRQAALEVDVQQRGRGTGPASSMNVTPQQRGYLSIYIVVALHERPRCNDVPPHLEPQFNFAAFPQPTRA